MSKTRQVYLLNSKEFSPETIAVTFAKTSRSPLSFREIASELTDEKSAQFHEKWVVGYGHASVAEHAVLHIAIENVSRLAIENIESNRLASYTEKSTRYQKWNPDAYFIPPELEGHKLFGVYQNTCQALFAAYLASLEAVLKVAARENPRNPGENQAGWERRIRSQSQDVCRYLLPACSLANVGMTANARVLEHAIQKMLSSPLCEVRQIGEEVKQTACAEVPTLVKYAEHLPSIEELNSVMVKIADNVPSTQQSSDWCHLASTDPTGENAIIAAALYRFGHASYSASLAFVEALTQSERQELIIHLLGWLGVHDIPLRELEHTSYTFDLTFDQGAYCEVKRHRMMTQTPQGLTAELGYTVPRWMTTAGFEGEYRQNMELAQQTYRLLAVENPYIASYIVPNGFNRRILLTLNLREAFHFCSLRSTTNAHFSVRRVALRIADEIKKQHPNLAAFMQLPADISWESIESLYFSQT